MSRPHNRLVGTHRFCADFIVNCVLFSRKVGYGIYSWPRTQPRLLYIRDLGLIDTSEVNLSARVVPKAERRGFYLCV